MGRPNLTGNVALGLKFPQIGRPKNGTIRSVLSDGPSRHPKPFLSPILRLVVKFSCCHLEMVEMMILSRIWDQSSLDLQKSAKMLP